jgi:hypothetical protein
MVISSRLPLGMPSFNSLLACMDVSACSTKHLKEIPPLSRFAKRGLRKL